MPKFYASGWNGNGYLGVGNYTNRLYHTEKSLGSIGIKKILPCTRERNNGNEAIFAIMSDGYVYCAGGNTTRYNEFTLMDNAHKYVDGCWLMETNAFTGTVQLLLVGEDGLVYRSSITTAGSVTTTLVSTNTNYSWGSKHITHCGCAVYNGRYRVILSDDSTVYDVDESYSNTFTDLASPTTYSITGTKKILAKEVVPNASASTRGVYIIDGEDDLYVYAMLNNLSAADTFNTISFSSSMPTTPSLFMTGVKDIAAGYGNNMLVLQNGTVKYWGWSYSSTDYASGYSNTGAVAIACCGSDSAHYLDSDGYLHVHGTNSYGQLGTGSTSTVAQWQKLEDQTYNVKSYIYLDMLASFVCDPLIVEIDITFWNPDGTGEVGLVQDVKQIKKISVGSYFPVPVSLIDVDDEEHAVSLIYSTNREFLGLATSAGGSVVYAAGETYDVDFTSDTNLYIVLGDIPSGDGFDVTFYRCSAEKNRVNKSAFLTPALSIKAILRASSSIYKPQLLIELFSVPVFNYCYIPAFQRYYWVTEITSVNNGLWLISMSCDRLMSFKSGILAAPSPVVARTANSNYQNALLPDDKMVKLPTKVIEEEEITNNVLMKNLTNLSNIYMLSVISSADSYVQIMPVSASPTMFVYDGAAHIPAFNLSLSGGGLYAVTGTTTPQVNKGTYSTTFTPATNVYWNDNHGSESRTIQWRIYDPDEQGQFFIIVYNKDYLPYPPDATLPRGQVYTIPSGGSYEPVREGYTFAGWKDGPTGTVYQPGDVFTPNANMSLTAQWT